MNNHALLIAKEIATRERTISLLGYDVIGTDAASNVNRMRKLREEIANLKEYGTPNPWLPQRLTRAVRHLWTGKNAKEGENHVK